MSPDAPAVELVEEVGNQAADTPTEHFLVKETSVHPRMLVHTTKKHPGDAFLHIDGKGFSLCVLLTPEQCREIGEGFLSAADAADAATS